MAEEVQDTPEISDAPQTSDISLPEPSVLLYVDRLRPPIGTSYFKRCVIHQFSDILS